MLDLGSLGDPNKHKLTLLRTKLYSPNKFHKRGTYHLLKIDGQTDQYYNIDANFIFCPTFLEKYGA